MVQETETDDDYVMDGYRLGLQIVGVLGGLGILVSISLKARIIALYLLNNLVNSKLVVAILIQLGTDQIIVVNMYLFPH